MERVKIEINFDLRDRVLYPYFCIQLLLPISLSLFLTKLLFIERWQVRSNNCFSLFRFFFRVKKFREKSFAWILPLFNSAFLNFLFCSLGARFLGPYFEIIDVYCSYDCFKYYLEILSCKILVKLFQKLLSLGIFNPNICQDVNLRLENLLKKVFDVLLYYHSVLSSAQRFIMVNFFSCCELFYQLVPIDLLLLECSSV